MKVTKTIEETKALIEKGSSYESETDCVKLFKKLNNKKWSRELRSEPREILN